MDDAPPVLELGASAGYIRGPSASGSIDARSASLGDARVAYRGRLEALRVLAEIRKQLRIGESARLALAGGLGIARMQARRKGDGSGSLAGTSVSVTETRTGLAWELTAGVAWRWGRLEPALGLRYAVFPEVSPHLNPPPVRWRPLGFYIEISY